MHTENSATAASRKHSCKWFGFGVGFFFFALFEKAPRKAKRKQEASALSGPNLTEKGHDSLKKNPTRSSPRQLSLLHSFVGARQSAVVHLSQTYLPSFLCFETGCAFLPPPPFPAPFAPREPGRGPAAGSEPGKGRPLPAARSPPAAAHQTGRPGQGEEPAAADRARGARPASGERPGRTRGLPAERAGGEAGESRQ